MNHRIVGLRAHALRSRRGPDRERGRTWQESLAQTVAEPAVIREARAFAHYCRTRTLVIHDDELIVGAQSCMQYDPVEKTAPRIFDRRTFTCSWPVSEDVQVLFREGMLSGAGNHIRWTTIRSSLWDSKA